MKKSNVINELGADVSDGGLSYILDNQTRMEHGLAPLHPNLKVERELRPFFTRDLETGELHQDFLEAWPWEYTGSGKYRTRSGRLPDRDLRNEEMTSLLGKEIIRIKTFPVNPGDHISIEFLDASSGHEHNLLLATEGNMNIDNAFETSQIGLTYNSQNSKFEIDILSTDGLLRLYNEWRNTDKKSFCSQGLITGMIEHEGDKDTIYFTCNDTDPYLKFKDLTFRVRRE